MGLGHHISEGGVTKALVSLNHEVYRHSQVQELLTTVRAVEWERGLLGFSIGLVVMGAATYLWCM